MQNRKLNFSIVVPVRNGEQYLRQCLESVRRQTVAANCWQCICVDDGSSDGSVRIMEEFSSGDGRFVAIESGGGGVGTARNSGLALARGKFIAFLDCDDLLEPQFLEELGVIAEDFSADICGCCHGNFSENGEPLRRWGQSKSAMLFRDPLSTFAQKWHKTFSGNGLRNYFVWGRLFRRDFLEKNNLSFSEIAIGEDTLFMLKAFHLTSAFAVTENVLCWHRRHGKSTMNTYNSVDYMENCIAVAMAAREWFGEKLLGESEMRKPVLRRIVGKIIYDGCMRGRRGIGYGESGAVRRSRLLKLRENGIFRPSDLCFRHRLRSELFLHFGV
ncbi:MAG: glycosyltransferase family 2 protein [Puniceicoccales bacterium]|nr:glycosyltransferase family 2 protein [Puniceicoccales bacterium]